MLLDRLLQQPDDSPRLHLRDAVYGAEERAVMLREVMGLANAEAGGPRHVLFGVSRRDNGALEYASLTDADFARLQASVELIRRYIEPELPVSASAGQLAGHLVAVLELPRCDDAPYILKTDVSRDLRCGACWVRDGGLFRPAQRADFDRMYRDHARRVSASGGAGVVRIGFNQDPEQRELAVALPDVSRAPSVLAAQRMRTEIDAREAARSVNVDDTGFVRLVQARLYGNERPYKDQGLTTLVEGYNAVVDRHRAEDDYYYFETQAVKLNFSVCNSGSAPLRDINVVLTLPWADTFRVAERLYPPPPRKMTAQESELMGYPRVKRYRSYVQVRQTIPHLEPGEGAVLFEQPLRIAVAQGLAGRKVRIRHNVTADGLANAEEGALKLLLTGTT